MTHRFTPLHFSSGAVAPNRVVIPAMASETADAAGLATEATFAHYGRLAGARPGLFFAEYTFVHRSGRSEPNQLGVDTDDHIVGLRRLAAIIRSSGAVAGLQLTHAGGKTTRELTGGLMMAPSAVPVPAKDRVLETPMAMDRGGIRLWHDAFVAAARRAAAAGFPLVELHAAHGYGLNQWLSPLTNQRQDAYGGDLDGRMRLILQIVAGIRAAAPALMLSVRIPGQDHLPGGLTQADALAVARRLTDAGVAIINVSSGLGGWRRPRDRAGEGYLVAEAAYIQAGLRQPVIGVGGIETAAYIDSSLAAGRFSLAAVGRAILADPAGWRARHLQPPGETQQSPAVSGATKGEAIA